MSISKPSTRWGFYRPLIVTVLAAGGLFQLVIPAIADPAAAPADATISNTATATYRDPVTNQTINTTSNTVTVKVAEVAGITVKPVSANDVSPGGGFTPGHTVEYIFEVKNIGNDPTRFFIPSTATLTDGSNAPLAAGKATQGTILISTDNGATYVSIPAGNLTASIPPNGVVLVKVPVVLGTAVATGDVIRVQLGDTGANDNSAATQNIQDTPDGAGTSEVRTVDNLDGSANETTGAPVNQEREASAFQTITVGDVKQSFAAVLKQRTDYSNSGTAALNDDLLTYQLGLRVDNVRPANSSAVLTPAPLAGTSISVDGATQTRVLVSDAVPAQTVLTGTPTAPAGWTVVYTNSPAATTNANSATWVTNPAAIGGIGNATRIGFINPGPIAINTTVSGFTFQVQTTGVTTTTTIANIAQLFGQTSGGTTVVYDESGDNQPNNYNSDGTPGSTTPTNGVADPATNGTDTGNNNGGDTTNPGLNGGGEDNVYTLTAPGSILNGPENQPGATGPSGSTNDDFSNKSADILLNTAPGTLIDPADVVFNNTFSSPTNLTNVLLVPSDLTQTNTLPTGTLVKITYNGNSVDYEYNGTDFVPLIPGTTPITVPSVTANTPVNYIVTVNLPPNTPLSTDLGTSRGDNPSYPVPIFAFQDANGDNLPNPTTEVSNATIDRVYTGFLRLFKEARILDANGTEIQPFSTAPATANVRPGNIIEYRVTYTNISVGQGANGANNRLLNAADVTITEDGITGNNNWAEDQNADGVIDTSNVPATATATNGTITFQPGGDVQGTTAATDVTVYINSVGATNIVPGGTGNLTFRRRVANNPLTP
jgi:hypothetical protein